MSAPIMSFRILKSLILNRTSHACHYPRHLNNSPQKLNFHLLRGLCSYVPVASSQSQRNARQYVKGTVLINKLRSRLRLSRNYSLISRKCWKCERLSNTPEEIFFCKCGVVQMVTDLSYFELIGIEESFDIDIKILSNQYKELQKTLHPDKHTLKSETEKRLYEENSSLVNKAYNTLLKPLDRALYMLERAGAPLEEVENQVDQELLMEIMEIHEIIAEADSVDALKDIDENNKKRLDENIQSLSAAFKQGDITLAKDLVIKLKYFTRIDDKIREIQRELF